MKKYIKVVVSGIFVLLFVGIIVGTLCSIPAKNIRYDNELMYNTPTDKKGLSSSGQPEYFYFTDNGYMLIYQYGEETAHRYIIKEKILYLVDNNGDLSKIGVASGYHKIELELYEKTSQKVMLISFNNENSSLIILPVFASIISVSFLIASLIELKKNNKEKPPQEKTEG